MKKAQRPDLENLGKLLELLDENPERAAARFVQLHETLVRVFVWRESPYPEELADETLDRVCRKIAAGEQIRDIPGYSHGVARLVFLESLKSPELRQESIEVLHQLPAPKVDDETEDERRTCLRRCLGRLPGDERELIIQYYREEKSARIDLRKKMADRLGLSSHTLRMRALRIRDKLEQCILWCLEKG